MQSGYSLDEYYADAAAAGYIPDFDQLPEQPEPKHWETEPTEKPPPAFRFMRGSELLALTPVKWLVHGILETGVMAGMFGASGSGKSFAAIDLSLCVANGRDWHGHKVSGGAVAYFAGEGSDGLRRRVSAWVKANGEAVTADNFCLSYRVCSLPKDTADVIHSIGVIPDLKMVVLDTLQRTMEGDENSSRDMSAYVQSIDKIKAAFPELCIVIVHHTGHGASDRARGSSVFRASLDAEILVSKEAGGVITATCTKMKDAEIFAPMSFKLESVTLEGLADNTGQPVTSAVLSHLEGHQAINDDWRIKVKAKNQKAAMIVLETLYQAQRRNLEEGGHEPSGAQVTVDNWVNDCVAQGITKAAKYFKRDVLNQLLEKGAIITPNGGVYVHIIGEHLGENTVRIGEKSED
ncbi:AAA family ATPase [Thiothrix sp.]|jgi:hypothetical protein|uniref:AAA family ATPase n=1 Tax=Thiothrix sp. TaxID=1032 RepID=UPI0025805278|nr:AAA family ATPase [Thiothrix sp.]